MIRVGSVWTFGSGPAGPAVAMTGGERIIIKRRRRIRGVAWIFWGLCGGLSYRTQGG